MRKRRKRRRRSAGPTVRKSEEFPAAQPEHLDGGLGPLGRGSQQRRHGGSFRRGRPSSLEEEWGGGGGEEGPFGGGEEALAGFVLEVVGVDELVEQGDGGALGLGVLHPEVAQVGPRMAGQTLAGLKPSTTQLADDVLVGVSLQGCKGTQTLNKSPWILNIEY